MLKVMAIIFIVLSVSSCGGNKEEAEVEVPSTTPSDSSGEPSSSVVFGGVESVSNITSSRAQLNWTAVNGVALYVVYDMTSGNPVYKASVASPASSIVLDDLAKDTAYTFRVRILDTSGLSDGNTVNQSLTTLNFSNNYSMQLGDPTYLDTGVVDDLSGSGDFSISVWFKGSNSGYLVSQSHLVSYSSDFIIGGTGASLFWMRSVVMGTKSDVEDGQWHHIVFVWNRSSETYKGYLDGVLLGESAVITDYGGIGTSVIVGSRGDATSSFADGLVDELAIYNKVLTDADVTALYNSGEPAPPNSADLMSWWRMGDDDNDDHTTIIDQEAVSNITAVGMNPASIVEDSPN